MAMASSRPAYKGARVKLTPRVKDAYFSGDPGGLVKRNSIVGPLQMVDYWAAFIPFR